MCVYFKLQAHLGGEEKAERRPTNAILVLSSQSCERFFFLLFVSETTISRVFAYHFSKSSHGP